MKNMDEILKLASDLVEVASVKGDTKSLKKVLDISDKKLKEFKSEKFLSKGVPSSFYSNGKKLQKKCKVILNAHLDVVPGQESQFKPIVLGDKLVGRGVVDMKGASAVEILVFKEVANKVNYPLGLQLVTDEEIGGFDGTKYQIEKGIKGEFVIAGEPTQLNIGNRAKGIIWGKLIAKGLASHGAYPWNGKNSVKILAEALQKLWLEFPIPEKEVWQTTVNVGRVLTTNETFNKVPDHSEAWLDVRYIPEEKNNVLKRLKSTLPKGVTFEQVVGESDHFTDKENIFLKNLLMSTKKVIGISSKVIDRHGASDVRHYSKVGSDGVEFGPVGQGLHSDNEWVSIKSLTTYYEVLKDFLLTL